MKNIRPCPWCGSSAILSIEKLWETTNGHTSGYVGNYCYYLKCCNPECGAIAPNGKIVDIYITPAEAEAKAIIRWNQRGDYE